MSYISTMDPIEGLEERCQRVRKILQALQKNGFENPITYGEGLSDFLNGNKLSETDLIIECGFPEKAKPGLLSKTFKTANHNRRESVYNLRGLMDTISKDLPELGGLTFGRGYLDDPDTIRLSTRGTADQKIQLITHNTTVYTDPIPSFEDALSKQLGTMNKVVMHHDEDEGTIIITRHKDWQADCQSGTFRIPIEASPREINQSLAYYFTQRSYGRALDLLIENTPDSEKSIYANAIHEAAMSVHGMNSANTGVVKNQDLAESERKSYAEAADFMRSICENEPF